MADFQAEPDIHKALTVLLETTVFGASLAGLIDFQKKAETDVCRSPQQNWKLGAQWNGLRGVFCFRNLATAAMFAAHSVATGAVVVGSMALKKQLACIVECFCRFLAKGRAVVVRGCA